MNHVEIYDQTNLCIAHIRKRLKENSVHAICENARTIEKSNQLWNHYLGKFKKEAFELINTSMSKPHVIYNVNRYYLI